MMMFFGKHREIPSSLDNAIDFRHFLTIPVTPEHIIYSEDKWKMVVSTKKGRKRMRHILSRSVIEYDYGNRNNLPNEQQYEQNMDDDVQMVYGDVSQIGKK
ncbi:MAG: hypothetical protein EZS28_003078 [Streblomastix strix]|uniref:Uncharacterized protein n=1 Tax=Streblomastix strix TaxID=222440 RepID=A0A5J4X2C8_9EUKA|nr:MAG: hypothetical protein EZS28_003078 [Streblomastix strix]